MIRKNIQIEIKCGSKFQEEFYRTLINTLMQALTNSVISTHIKNKITILTDDLDSKEFRDFSKPIKV